MESEAEKYIRFDHGKPLLSDLERLRPSSQPNPHSRDYVQRYKSLIDAMCHSFTSRQLREFAREYKLGAKFIASKLTKDRYAGGIVSQQWGWPSLQELAHKTRMETEVITRSFAVDPSQLFLIMGKDGGALLKLSQTHRVHISLTHKPLALRVEGVRSRINDVAETITSVKDSIIEEKVKLPSKEPLNPELLERISRTVGAFIENTAEGQVRICAREPFSLAGARRLALRAASDDSDRVNQIFAYRPSGHAEHEGNILLPPNRYFLYPFINSRPLPWSTGTDGVFRWRRVIDFLEVNQGENIAETGGLAAGRGGVLTATEFSVMRWHST
ncbi:hypothetical protein EWM64_g3533 [Hericium alpestre]|uniref:K Homology domain-containing protein n=1 Tax=Hericium alpestre TaxID=135208 RepID=A0A4Z0A3N8_9AGAM|nr:hypothetical protein EWM64_g3533 [Hericium alpestre]